MVDPRLLVRLDALVALVSLTLLVLLFGLVVLDPGVGLVAAVGVAVLGAVGLRSYRRELARAADAAAAD